MIKFLVEIALSIGRLVLGFLPVGIGADFDIPYEFLSYLSKGIQIVGINRFLIYMGSIFSWIGIHLVLSVALFIWSLVPIIGGGD